MWYSLLQLKKSFNSHKSLIVYQGEWSLFITGTLLRTIQKLLILEKSRQFSLFMSLKTNVEYLDKDFQDKAGDVIVDLYLADFYKVRYAIFSILFLISHLAATQPTLSY